MGITIAEMHEGRRFTSDTEKYKGFREDLISLLSNTPKLPHRPNNLPNIPPARLLAIPPEYIALEARFDAWLNLSHREKARVLVIVRTNAIAAAPALISKEPRLRAHP